LNTVKTKIRKLRSLRLKISANVLQILTSSICTFLHCPNLHTKYYQSERPDIHRL